MTRDYKIEWEELEYEFFEKKSDWFWALGIISISIAVTSVILGNLLFAILILVGSFTLALYAAKKPDIVHYEINQKGVVIEDKLYPYNSLDSFWVDSDREKPKLLVTSKKLLAPHIIIPLNEELDTDMIRDYLLDRVDEEEQRESLSTQIMEYLGF
jgi:hypothetical protein